MQDGRRSQELELIPLRSPFASASAPSSNCIVFDPKDDFLTLFFAHQLHHCKFKHAHPLFHHMFYRGSTGADNLKHHELPSLAWTKSHCAVKEKKLKKETESLGSNSRIDRPVRDCESR